MKSQVGLDAVWLERLRSGAEGLLALSLLIFFVSVVLIGAEVGDPVFAENVASLSSLTIALSAFTYISFGLIGAGLLPLPVAKAARISRSSRPTGIATRIIPAATAPADHH